MSLPQRMQLANSSSVEKEKQSPLAAIFPGMPFFSPVSTANSVFPNPMMFPPGFQQLYANLFQQQLLQQIAQQQSPNIRSDLSPSLSDHTSSGTETPSKKLAVDEDGSPVCPMCNEKLEEADWKSHLDMEKGKLKDIVIRVKHAKESEVPSTAECRRSREAELARVRQNMQRRLAVKRGGMCSIATASSSNSPINPFNELFEAKEEKTLKCVDCQRIVDCGIIRSIADGIRCEGCDSLRNHIAKGAHSLTCSPLDMSAEHLESSDSGIATPPQKRIKLE